MSTKDHKLPLGAYFYALLLLFLVLVINSSCMQQDWSSSAFYFHLFLYGVNVYVYTRRLVVSIQKSSYLSYSSVQCCYHIVVIILIYAYLYSFIEMNEQGQFSGLLESGTIYRYIDFIYFSVMVFSTVGFGDIAPQTSLTRLLVTSEIIVAFATLVMAVNFFRGDKEEAKKEEEEKKDG